MAVQSSSTARLRALDESDLAAVVAIEKESSPAPWSEGIFRDCLQAGYHCLVAVGEDDVPFGFVVLASGAGEAHLLNIALKRKRRGRGLGRHLLDAVLQYATEQRAKAVFLEVRASNRVALELYDRAGFQRIGSRRNYYACDDGRREDALVMRFTPV